MNAHLKPGDQLRVTGQSEAAWVVMTGEPIDGYIKLFDREKHSENYVKVDDIYEKVQIGQWRVKRKNAPLVSAVEQYHPAYREDLLGAIRHLEAVHRAMKDTGRSFAKAYELVRAEHAQKASSAAEEFPALPTLYRYRCRWMNGFSLLKGQKNKGRREARYDSQVDRLIYDCAKQNYLVVGSSWTMGRLVELINDRLHSLGLLRQSEKISQRYIRKVIMRDITVDPDRNRLDPRKVAAERSVGARRITVSLPFERVEQDAVHLPFVVKYRNHVTSSVWVIHAIDCATSRVVGWTFVIGSPSETDGLKCVASILFSKKQVLMQHGLDPSFDIRGTPSLLVFDNGAEAKGQRMSKLTQLMIDAEYCPSRHPHKKPFVERLNRSLKEALETLPGSTRMNGVDGRRNPIELGEELMTFEELQRWVVRWYFMDWANKPLERLTVSEMAGELAAEHTAAGARVDQAIAMPSKVGQ
jgi:putative transposase